MNFVDVITSGAVESLFIGHKTAAAIKKRFAIIAKEVHPDVNPDPRATDAFTTLSTYYNKLEHDPNAKAADSKIVVITNARGVKSYAFFIDKRDGDLGEVFTTKNYLVTRYVDVKDAAAAAKTVNALKGVLVGGSLAPYLNVVPDVFVAYENDTVFSRRSNTASIRAVTEKWGDWDPRHATWLASCLLDFSCLMDNQKMVHCALTPDNVFVDTENHSIQVMGGWAFASARGSKISRLPRFVHSATPKDALKNKKAVGSIDVAASKAIINYVLGKNYNAAPPAPKAWVSIGVAADADPVDEYEKWESVRGAAFGPRKFVKHDHVASDAYQEK